MPSPRAARAALLKSVERFAPWRARLGLSPDEAAQALGISRRQAYYYDDADRLPWRLRLAMLWIEEHPQFIGGEA
jgi:DNA-binding XRE family transcriptional regulator